MAVDRERLYELSGRESRALAAIGAFQVIDVDDLRAPDITCNRMLKVSGCVFSISSSSSTLIGVLADRVDQQAALLEASVARRRANGRSQTCSSADFPLEHLGSP